MLLYHSVGTGKTCSAIAAATTNFEPFDYTILWVTRTTLKSDIWKNMFDQVCHKGIQDRIAAGEVIPDVQKERMRLLSRAWRIRPLSYKQFSNLVSKKNRYYEQLVKENGEADPLQKTLLIIDEAHKLYGGGDLSSIERPDMKALHQSLMNSYAISGMNSVRLLLMTATPITENPLELVQLINLCRPIDQQIADTFDLFSAQYLKEDGTFTPAGQSQFLDEIAGHISYLNREKDARQFSQPIIKRILTSIVPESQMKYVDDFDKFITRSESEDDILKLEEQLQIIVKKLEDELRDINKFNFRYFYERCLQYTDIPAKKCASVINKNITELLKEIKDYTRTIKDQIKTVRGELKDIKQGRQRKLSVIKQKIKENPRLFLQYKSSSYATIRENCSKKTMNDDQFIQAVQNLPEVLLLEDEIKARKEKITMLENQLEIEIQGFKQKIIQMREMMREPNIAPIEKSVLQYSVRDSKKIFRETKKNRTKEIQGEIKVEQEEIKQTEKEKKNLFNRIRKTIKKQKKQREKEEKQSRKREHDIRKKTDLIISEIKDVEVKGLAQHREEIIRHDLEMLERELQRKTLEKLHKQREKDRKRAEKDHENRIKKELKKREKEEEKERKNLEKTRKKQEQQQKANKTRKEK